MIQVHERSVLIASHGRLLEGDLTVPEGALGLVLFAHGSGSSRLSPPHLQVARAFHQAHLATLRLDLLTTPEEMSERWGLDPSSDIELLASRLLSARAWALLDEETQFLPLGYFGDGLGASAALVATARQPEALSALVCRSGRPDLVPDVLPLIPIPTLFIVGANDEDGIALHQPALDALRTERKSLRLVPGASHTFSEPGALDDLARLGAEWFSRCFRATIEPGALGWSEEQGRWI